MYKALHIVEDAEHGFRANLAVYDDKGVGISAVGVLGLAAVIEKFNELLPEGQKIELVVTGPQPD